MKNAKTSDMRHKVKLYKQVNVRNRELGTVETRWIKDFEVWCREVTIYREQLETIVSGAETLRDRKEFECRLTKTSKKISSRHRLTYQGKMYRVSIVGDTNGTHDRIRFLAEALEDGGA